MAQHDPAAPSASTSQHAPMFLVLPAWQGSSSTRAMLLADGAAHLRDDLPASARYDVPVPVNAGDALGTPVARLSSVLQTRDATREVLRHQHARTAITVGGDCAATLAGLEHISEHYPGVAVLWFDAQPDLQDPSTSPSGAAAGMTLRHALGEGTPDLASQHPLDPARVLLVGARDAGPEEQASISSFGLATANVASAADWLAASGATHVYIHVDLDVLDPAEFSSVHSPVPFGLTVQELTDAIKQAVSTLPLVGAAISEFAPADDHMAADDAPTVLRILGALTSGSRATGTPASGKTA